ncbi:hypothetical protein RND71_010403 [Anisodus tanguticus]|uniref:Tetraspanin n=1 Tax=Anisodus tanguticus TaxID=243964 RepID=A0AAE1VI44_9SOLA|nr:hypothetical protein RND71_010403 [Anisodus tanguticus]
MVRVSNFLISFVNVLTFMVAIMALGFGLWFKADEGKSLCQKSLYMPLLIFGASLLVLSLMGLIGSCCRASFFLWIYLFFLFLLIVGMICLSVFTILVTNKGVGKALSGKRGNEAKFGDWRNWLEKHVVDEKHWDEIKSCMATFKYCQMIPHGKSADFYKYNLSTAQDVGLGSPPLIRDLDFESYRVVVNHLLTAALSSQMQHTGLCQKQDQPCQTVTAKLGAIHRMSSASIANHARPHTSKLSRKIGTKWHS